MARIFSLSTQDTSTALAASIGEEMRACDTETRADYFRQSEMTVFGKVPPIQAARVSNPASPWRKGAHCLSNKARQSYVEYCKRGGK